MDRSLKIASVGGVPIRVHWSFSLLLLLVAYDTSGRSSSALWWTLLWIVALFASVTVHELAHCAVARRRGLSVKNIVLLPIGGVSQIAALGASPRTERDVAIAGPLASLALALGFALIAVASGASLLPPSLLTGSWFSRLAWLNLILAGFNLLPALPMDGGRVLRAVLAGRGDATRATAIAATVAQLVGVAMIAFGAVVADWWLVFIGVFVMIGAQAERQQGNFGRTLTGVKVGHIMIWDPTAVPASVTAGEVAPWLLSFEGRAVPVLLGQQYLGMLGREELLGAPPSATAASLCDQAAPVLDIDQEVLPFVIEAFAGTRRAELAVMSGGRPAGVLYRAALERVLRQGYGSAGQAVGSFSPTPRRAA